MRYPKLIQSSSDSENSYFVSLSDLIIGLLFIFIIMLMAFALNYSESMITVQTEKEQLQAKNQQLSDASNERKALLEKLKSTLKEQGVTVEIDTNNGILRLPEALLFEVGKAEFNDAGLVALAIVSKNLATFLPCYAEQEAQCSIGSVSKRKLEAIFIEGHTDNVPIYNSDFKDNWDLSVARAKTTYLALIKASPILEQLNNERAQPLLSFSAYADKRPIAASSSASERRKNRRIDLRFIMATPSAIKTPLDLNTEVKTK